MNFRKDKLREEEKHVLTTNHASNIILKRYNKTWIIESILIAKEYDHYTGSFITREHIDYIKDKFEIYINNSIIKECYIVGHNILVDDANYYSYEYSFILENI